MDNQFERIEFLTDDGEKIEFFVIEETRISGINYLMVSEDFEGDEAEVYILKDTSTEIDDEACYEFVEDEEEINAVAGVFEKLMEDSDYAVEQ